METASYIDEIEIIPNYAAGSLKVKYFDTLLRKESKIYISFLEVALKISPSEKGKISAGYLSPGFDETMGGNYLEFHEIIMEPVAFFGELFEADGEYKLCKELKKMFYQVTEEACRSIIARKN